MLFCIAAWILLSVLSAAIESRLVLSPKQGFLSAHDQRLTFLHALWIQAVILGAGGVLMEGALRVSLRFVKKNHFRRFSPATFTANMLTIALFLPIGLYINVHHLGRAYSLSSLLATFGILMVFFTGSHIFMLVLGKILPSPSLRLVGIAVAGGVFLCLIDGLVLMDKPVFRERLQGVHPDAPNLVLLTLDTVRADHTLPNHPLGRELSPHLNRIFEQGTVFTQAYVPLPVTIASHATMFTGLYPASHGVMTNFHRLDEGVATLAEILEERGYQTGAFISSFVLEPGAGGMQRGFQVYDYDFFSSQWIPGPVAHLTPVYILSVLGFFDLLERDAAAVTDTTLQWLETVEEPFYLWVHYWDPHRPYAPPEPYATQSNPDYDGPLPLDTYGLMHQPDSYWMGRPREVEHFRALYGGEVRYMDDQIERLYSALKAHDLLENTILVAISDHGEALGEKDLYFKHTTVYEFDVHIPLYLRFPESLASRLGIQRHLVDEVVESVDLFPTLLEALEIELDLPYDIQGHSLLPLMRGEEVEWKERAFLESWDCQGLRMGRWKWVRDSQGQEWLFDLEQDALEQQDIESATPELALSLRREHERIREKLLEVQFYAEQLTDPATLERLEKMGYLRP